MSPVHHLLTPKPWVLINDGDQARERKGEREMPRRQKNEQLSTIQAPYHCTAVKSMII